MMWHTKEIFNEIYAHTAKVEERFRKDVPDWASFDRFAGSRWSRLSFGVLYVVFYYLCISVFELPGTHWAMYALLPIHFLIGPVHGAIVNWSGHKYGYSNFDNNDLSKNSLVVDFLMLGELFQNNHHKLPNRANFGVRWYEVDPIFPAVKLLNFCRIIRMKPMRISVNQPSNTEAKAA